MRDDNKHLQLGTEIIQKAIKALQDFDQSGADDALRQAAKSVAKLLAVNPVAAKLIEVAVLNLFFHELGDERRHLQNCVDRAVKALDNPLGNIGDCSTPKPTGQW